MNNPFDTDETLEEGRVALDRLERQLRLRASNQTPDALSETSSRLQSSLSRKKLDQLPRVARLTNRDESLGLTVEELDDRGLLDGGGSVPSYYTSLKQKNRRTLELQPRSTRLQERGKEGVSKVLNAVFHMLRTYVRWGINVENKFLQADTKRLGTLPKKVFLNILKRIELPFRQKELNDVANHYFDPSTEKVEYLTMLKNANLDVSSMLPTTALQIKSNTMTMTHAGGQGPSSPSNQSISSHQQQWGPHKNVLRDVKRMLMEAIKTLNKNFDDLYRMFARWDTDGSGTVTATQFLRVLNRLHVDMSDSDQDFLVELLDTQGMGRIDFESLLTYCLMSTTSSTASTDIEGHQQQLQFQSNLHANPSDILHHDNNLLVDTDDVGGETVSAMSLDGNTSLDMKSSTTPLGMLKRPWTASNPRGPRSPGGLFESFGLNNTGYGHHNAVTSGGGYHPYHSSSNNLASSQSSNNQMNDHSNPMTSKQRVRPMTALARVSSSNTHDSSPNKRNNQQAQSSSTAAGRGNPHAHFDTQNVNNDALDQLEVDLLMDLPDDVIHGEENYLQPTGREGNVEGSDQDLYFKSNNSHNYVTSSAHEQSQFPHQPYYGAQHGKLQPVTSRFLQSFA